MPIAAGHKCAAPLATSARLSTRTLAIQQWSQVAAAQFAKTAAVMVQDTAMTLICAHSTIFQTFGIDTSYTRSALGFLSIATSLEEK